MSPATRSTTVEVDGSPGEDDEDEEAVVLIALAARIAGDYVLAGMVGNRDAATAA